MDRAGKRVRDVKFYSEKNGALTLVHSEEARAYTRYLEERPEVASYEACKALDMNRLNGLQKTDIGCIISAASEMTHGKRSPARA